MNRLSSALSGLITHTSGYVAGSAAPFRMGDTHPSLFPYEPLPTADGDLVVGAGNDGQFRKLCEVLGLPELPTTPGSAAPRTAPPTARRCARSWSRGWCGGRGTSGSGT